MTYSTGHQKDNDGNNSYVPSHLIGQRDVWYLYAKAELIGKAILNLLEHSPADQPLLTERITLSVLDLVSFASEGTVHAVARDDLSFKTLELSSLVRLSGAAGLLDMSSVSILSEELRRFSDRLSAIRGGLGFALDESFFSIPTALDTPKVQGQLRREPETRPSLERNMSVTTPVSSRGMNLNKGHESLQHPDKGQLSDRSRLILEVVKEKGAVSIRDIASAISGCSEKTIQRELVALIERGLIKREGERRWSTYSPAQ